MARDAAVVRAQLKASPPTGPSEAPAAAVQAPTAGGSVHRGGTPQSPVLHAVPDRDRRLPRVHPGADVAVAAGEVAARPWSNSITRLPQLGICHRACALMRSGQPHDADGLTESVRTGGKRRGQQGG